MIIKLLITEMRHTEMKGMELITTIPELQLTTVGLIHAIWSKALRLHPNLKFVIVGKKEKLLNGDDEVIKMVEDDTSEFKDSVVFTGHISDGELAFIYQHAVCLVFASLYEGFGIPPLEAMIFNCPVIVNGRYRSQCPILL